MWRVCRAAGRPWPVLSDDPVVDYMVMEAVYIKANQEEERAQKEAATRREARETAKGLVQRFG